MSLRKTDAGDGGKTGESDPDVLQRYRKLTLWTAIIMSIVPVVVCLLTLALFAKDFVDEQRAEFNRQAAEMQLAVTRRETWVRMSAIYEQTVAQQLSGNRDLLERLVKGDGRLIIKPLTATIQMEVWANPTDISSYDRYARYLAMAEDYDFHAGPYLKWLGGRISFTAFMFSPDRKFIVIMRSPDDQGEIPIASYAQAYEKLQKAFPKMLLGSGSGQADLADGRVHWLLTRPEMLTTESTLSVVQAALIGDSPFLILGSTLPLRELGSIIGEERTGEIAGILTPDAKYFLRAGVQTSSPLTIPAAVRKIVLSDSDSEKRDSRFVRGRVLLRRAIDGPGWTFLRYFSIATMASDLSAGVILNIAASLLAVALIWMAWLWLERKVFAPGRQQSRLIYESEQLNRAVVNNSPAGISLFDPKSGKAFLQNEAAAEYVSRAEAAHLPLMNLAIAGRDRDATWLADGKPQTHAISFPETGKTLDLQMTVVPTRYRGADALLCTFTDITAQKEIERELKIARDAADAASRAKTTFFAATSHEIRTPLNVILGNLELLNRSELSDFQAQRLQAVTSATSLLLGIINDILDFAKLEADQLPLEQIPFDLVGIAEHISEAFAPMAQAKGLRFERSIDPSLAERYVGDPNRVRQIVFNLLGNALKFTERGEVALEIYPTNDDVDSAVGITVTDTGIGINREHQDQLFKPFAQADPSIPRRFGGTGLGLAICARLAQAMNGRISLESEAGVGSAFTLELPLRATSPAAENDAASSDYVKASAPLANPTSLRFLVVDDTAPNRELIALQLERLGQHVELAENGLDALQRFAAHSFDLVLTDVNMPVMDGPDLARQLRAHGVEIPIIAITAHTDPAEHERCRASGINAVLIRPLLMDELDVKIRELVQVSNGAAVPSKGVDFAQGNLPARVFQKLSETFEYLSAQIRQSAVRSDRDALLRDLHSVKGGFAMIHEHTFVTYCEELEQFAQQESFSALLNALDEWEHCGISTLTRRSGKE